MSRHSCRNLCHMECQVHCPTAPMRAFRTCRYCDGWKRCCTCQRAFKTPAVFCPCCSYVMRSKPRQDAAETPTEIIKANED